MKFGTATGTTRSRVALLALMATAAVGIAGCGGSGRTGSGGSVGPTGPTGPTGSGGALAISQADVVNVTVVTASVASGTLKPTVTFQLTNSEGKPLDGLQAANVRVTFAKVIPGANWVPSEWQSYISRVNNPDPTANPVPPATPAAEQKPTEYATYESAVATVGGTPCTAVGVFEVLGGGQYKYTFSKGLPEYSGVSYNPSETQRVGIQLRGDTTCAPGANTDKLIELTPQALVTNGVYDFVPGGGLPVSPDIIDPAAVQRLSRSALRPRRWSQRLRVLRDLPQPGHRAVGHEHLVRHDVHGAPDPHGRQPRHPVPDLGTGQRQHGRIHGLSVRGRDLSAGHAQLPHLPQRFGVGIRLEDRGHDRELHVLPRHQHVHRPEPDARRRPGQRRPVHQLPRAVEPAAAVGRRCARNEHADTAAAVDALGARLRDPLQV